MKWKVVFLVLGLALLAGASLGGYRLWRWWSRPNFARDGGVILTYAIDEEASPPDSYQLDDLLDRIRRRLDPGGFDGVEVRSAEAGLVEILLPRFSPEAVESVKAVLARRGQLEFRIVANRTDDGAGLLAAEAWLNNEDHRGQLEERERRAKPPPPPRDLDSGSLLFPVKLASGDEEQHRYSWVELGKSELFSLGLNAEALKETPVIKALVERALKKHTTFTPPQLDRAQALMYVRKITDWSRRSEKDEKLGKTLEFFVLLRDPQKGQEVTGDFLERAAEGHPGDGDRAIEFSLNREGGNRFYDLTSNNRPTGDPLTGFHRHLAIIFDGQVYSAPRLNEPIRAHGQITGRFTQEEVQDVVRILRAGALPALLKPEPVSETTVGPSR
jgi:SecD/SecF fusion protein